MVFRWLISVVVGLSLAVAAAVPLSAAQLCDGDDDCTGDDACIGGACVPPVDDPDAYAAAAALRRSSYWWAFQLPALFDPPEACCFDFTGDGQPDDAFGGFVASLAQILGVDFNGSLAQAIESGEAVAVMDWRELSSDLVSGDVQVSVFSGKIADGAPFADRQAGLGHYLLERSSFGPYGALSQLNDGSVATGQVDVTGDELRVVTLAPTGDVAEVALHDPILSAPVVFDDAPGASCHGLCTVDEDRGPSHVPQIVGGALLGGLVYSEEVYAGMDHYYRTCSCAGVDPTQPVITWGPSFGAIRASCTSNTGDPALCPPEDPCSSLDDICLVLPFVGNELDIDRDGDSVDDSFSAGFRVAWSGAAIDGVTQELFLDGFESGDTTAWSSAVP